MAEMETSSQDSSEMARSEYSSQRISSDSRSYDREPSLRDCGDVTWNIDAIIASLGFGWSYTPVRNISGGRDTRSCFFTKVAIQRPKRLKKMRIVVNVQVVFDKVDGWNITADRHDGKSCRPYSDSSKTGMPLYGFVDVLKGFLSEEEREEEETEEDVLVEEEMLQMRLDCQGKSTDFPAHLTHFPASLPNLDIRRFSRQLILPEIGVSGQLALKTSSVLIVGAGGLGCPAGVFLAAAGVGKIGIVDYDVVEISNLHRQIAHSEAKVDVPKAVSLAQTCKGLNSSCEAIPLQTQISSSNALELVSKYDIVLDCTDNVATRYLLNDACILCSKTLVSGSALRWEGQLTVYNHNSGPCYRCLFPTPPPPETVTNCSDGGVVGVVPGVIGSLQALETIKILCGAGTSCSQQLLLFDGLTTSFRKIKLRNRKVDCHVCGKDPLIKELIDYEQFCGSSASDKAFSLSLLLSSDRVSVSNYHKDFLAPDSPHLLIDVRTGVETEICRLPSGSKTSFWNLPIEDLKRRTKDDEAKKELLTDLEGRLGGSEGKTKDVLDDAASSSSSSRGTLTNHANGLSRDSSKDASGDPLPVFVVCRRGNDSQVAVSILKELKMKSTGEAVVEDIRDIVGGLHAWANRIDSSFPVY